ncbi:baseplate tail tube cap [Citrobacter phage Ci1]|nr:baseplate tail tube cap [Citrobacter phage Ci1]
MASVNILGSSKDIAKTAKTAVKQLVTGGTARGGVVPIAYPSSLDDNIHDSYLVFYAVKPVSSSGGLSVTGINERQLNSVKGKFSEEMISVIQLYVPNMVETLNHSYDSNEANLMTDMINAIAPHVGSAFDAAGSGNMSGVGDSAMAAGRDVRGVLSGKVDELSTRVRMESNTQTSGQILGDRNIVLFKGTSPRTQTFTFYLTPRNKDELVSIAKIIKSFYVNSSPRIVQDYENISSILYQVPPLWYVEERTKNNAGPRFTPKFQMGPAAITSIRMNKTPEQIYQTIAGTAGDAKTIEFEIQLSEMRPTTADYWEEAFKNLGKYTVDEDSPFGSYK